MDNSESEKFIPTDPVALDAMVLAAETSVFLNPKSLNELGDTDAEFWESLAELVPEPNEDPESDK